MSLLPQSPLFQVKENLPWVDAAPGIQRQVYGYDNKIMLVKVKFEKAAVGAVHQHHHVQASYVESGVFEITIGDEKKILKAGDGFYVPAGMLHGAVCLEPGILIDVFSPYREDFLPDR
jgi:quercetin dioxygenase-like cupin family protein